MQVLAFSVVEAQRGRERIEHIGRRTAAAALLQARVVVDADPASLASSSRRRPGTRRRVAGPSSPTSCGEGARAAH